MLYIDGIIYNLQAHGGITVYFNQIKQELARTKYPYALISYLTGSNSGSAGNVELNLELPKPRIFERYRNVVIKSKDPAVLHSSYYRVSEQKNVKNITTVHDFTYEKYVKGFASKVHCWQKYNAINKSDAIICVSENTALDLMKYCPIDENRIHVIHNGVSNTYKPNNVVNILVKTEVLFIGSRASYKNFGIAVKAISPLKHLTLGIVGGGSLNDKERSMLEKYLKNRYQVLGKLTDEQLNSRYNDAYALLYPSLYEGFGIPILEAMRSGCPVVAMNNSSIPEVAGSAAILIDESEAQLFTEALLNIESSRSSMIANGFLQAEKFSWNTCVEKTINLYNKYM